jgi:hypothetical protein
VAQIGGEEELEKVLFCPAADGAVPHDEARRKTKVQGPRLPRLVRRVPRLPGRRLEEEVQVPDRVRVRAETAWSAGENGEADLLLVRRERGCALPMDDGSEDRAEPAPIARELQPPPGQDADGNREGVSVRADEEGAGARRDRDRPASRATGTDRCRLCLQSKPLLIVFFVFVRHAPLVEQLQFRPVIEQRLCQ